jgi:hypothetical protein
MFQNSPSWLDVIVAGVVRREVLRLVRPSSELPQHEDARVCDAGPDDGAIKHRAEKQSQAQESDDLLDSESLYRVASIHTE